MGEGAAGTVFGSELESSTTDTSGQFSNMISAQQAYSAASQVITTVNKMYDTLMSAMRLAVARPKNSGFVEGEALLRRLRRLKIRADDTGAESSRAQLIALMDDIESVRRKLLRECARLDEELKLAAVRVTAITAYTRVARSNRQPYGGGQ